MNNLFAFFSMKKILCHISILIVLIFLLNNIAYSACADANGGVLTAEDTTRCAGEATRLTLTGSIGSITWLTRVNGTSTWEIIPGEFNTEVIVIPTENRDYTALLVGSCTDTSNIVTVYVSSFGTMPVTGTAGGICGTKFQLFADGVSAPLTGYWQQISGAGTSLFYPSIYSSITDSVVVSESGTYEFAWHITDGICTKDTVVEVISLEEPIANAGRDSNYCGSNFELSAQFSISGSTGEWRKISGGFMTISEPNNPNTSVNANPGSYTLRWEEDNSSCLSSEEITIVVADMPVANAGADTNVCGKGLNLYAEITSGFGNWSLLSGPDSVAFANSNAHDSYVEAISIGSGYLLLWTKTNSFCTDSDTLEVSFVQIPETSATLVDSSCGVEGYLTSEIDIGEGIWEFLSGDGTANILAPNSDSCRVDVSNPGNYSFQWKETNLFCSDSIEVRHTFIEMPQANGGSPDSICGQSTTLSADLDASHNGYWSVLGSGINATFTDPLSPNSGVEVDSYGNIKLLWNVGNLLCSNSDTVEYLFIKEPTAYIEDFENPCGITKTLYTDSLGTDSGHWYIHDTVDLKIDSLIQERTYFRLANDAYGEYDIEWIVENLICTDTIREQLMFAETPGIIGVLDTALCGKSVELTINKTVPGAVLSWGETNLSIDSTGGGRFRIWSDNTGEYKIEWKATNNHCVAVDSMSIEFAEIPRSLPGEGGLVCGETYYAEAIATAGTGTWGKIEGPGNCTFVPSENDGSARITVDKVGNYAFNWSVSNGLCSTDSIITLSFISNPVVTIEEDKTICGDSTTLFSSTSAESGAWSVVQKKGEVIIGDETSNETSVGVSEFGSYHFQWKSNNDICSDSAQIIVEFLEKPELESGYVDSACGLGHTLKSNPTIYDSYWYLYQGDGVCQFLTDSTLQDVDVNVSTAGNYRFIRCSENGSCRDTSVIDIIFLEYPSAYAGEDIELDNVFETEIQAGASNEGYYYTWRTEIGDGVVASPSEPQAIVRGLSLGENYLSLEVGNGICISTDTLKITVYDIFIPEVITPNNDMENDYFIIRGIENIPGVELSVFNRWGVEVFNNRDYNNDWGGTNKNGELLTNDTYFYVLKVSETRVLKGFVVIKK